MGAKGYYALAGNQLDDRTAAGVNAVSGNLLTYTDTGGTVGYGVDAAGRLTSVTEPNGAITTLGYDAANGHTTTYPASPGVGLPLAYDASERLTQIASTKGGGYPTNFSYSYLNPNR